jgi:uncharacterized protein YukE
MAMLGLDPGRVSQEIQAPFKSCSTQITDIIRTLTTVVDTNLGNGANYAWTGADAMQFKSDWKAHQAKLQEVKNMLDNAVTTLQRNIEAQQNTSSGGSGNFV